MLMELGQKIFGRSLRFHFFDIMVASSVALTNQQ